jgi:DNA-binding NtrC family response regulator
MKRRILIVDDEPGIRKVLKALLARDGHEVETASDGLEAKTLLAAEPFHLVVSDLRMPGLDGLGLLEWVGTHQPGLPVLLITAHGTVDSAVDALKRGAYDYITKPFDQDELRAVVEKALRTETARRGHLTVAAGETGRFALVGRTPAMMAIYERIQKVANSPTTVLITGESGTGKELVARALHAESERRDAPFIEVNCGAIPEALFESELFGHERGAFTGAVTARPGRFELAHGGTLFLDEVGELPRDMQVKLLRVLQERRFDRVGGIRSTPVDVRLVAATNRDLLKMVREGRFREDLYYRLAVIPIHLPPLRERKDDIPLLVQHFLTRFAGRLKRRVDGLSADALAALAAWRWPGNIRELENLLERAVVLSDAPVLGLADLPGLDAAEPPPPPADADAELGLKEYVRAYTVQIERARIQRILSAESANVTRAARRLGISRKSLQLKMKEYGLRDESDRRAGAGDDDDEDDDPPSA